MNSVREEGPTLRTANPADRIALRGVRLTARLSGMSQKTTIEQTFVNLERRAVEAVYTFPLPESAAVCGFEVATGDRFLTGTIEEAGQAIEQYEQAVSQGDGAFLLEQDRPDVFTVRVGNLKPGQAATIRLTYVCPLERVDKSVRVAFPTTVAPRYVTATATDPIDAAIDGDALNPPHVLRVPYGLSLDVEIDLGRRLRGVHSPSHSIRVDSADESRHPRTRVTLAGGVTEMDRDVVLLIDLHKEHEPSVQVGKGPAGNGEGAYLAVTFVPEFDEAELAEPEPVETVFVLDCSGSMQGDSIRQATAALELCLRSLSTGDTFNVCRFGSTFELMSSEPLHYSEQTLRQAIAYVRRNADLGGTELYAALHAVLAPSPRVGRTRQVIVLTDGQVSNEPAILDLARQMRPRNRIFSFGIGAAASAGLVNGLARATGGASEFITEGERIDEKVLRTFGRMASPMISDVSIDWDGCDVQTLAEMPQVFDGDVLTVFGRAPGRPPKRVTLTCRTPTGPAKWTVAVPPPLDDGGVIATMWARRTIQSLEEVNGLHQSRHVRRGAPQKSREEETVIRLSKQFNLLSSLTTFIAVEHRSEADRNNGEPALHRVPVMLAKEWGGIAAPAAAGGAFAAMPMFSVGRGGRSRDTADRLFHAGFDGSVLEELRASKSLRDSTGAGAAAYDGRPRGKLRRFLSKMAPPKTALRQGTADAPRDDLQSLLSLLNSEGAFARDPLVDTLLAKSGRDAAAWRRVIAKSLPAQPLRDADGVVQTVTVLLLLRDRFAPREDLWRRAAGKARRYVRTTLDLGPGQLDAWLKQLEAKLLTRAEARQP